MAAAVKQQTPARPNVVETSLFGAIDIPEDAEVDEAAFKALIHAAVAENVGRKG